MYFSGMRKFIHTETAGKTELDKQKQDLEQ